MHPLPRLCLRLRQASVPDPSRRHRAQEDSSAADGATDDKSMTPDAPSPTPDAVYVPLPDPALRHAIEGAGGDVSRYGGVILRLPKRGVGGSGVIRSL